MCFESSILQGTGAELNMAGAGIFMYGKWEVLTPLFPPLPHSVTIVCKIQLTVHRIYNRAFPPPSVTSSGQPLCVLA